MQGITPGLMQNAVWRPQQARQAGTQNPPVLFGSRYYLRHPKKPEFEPELIPPRKAQDVLARTARKNMPALFQLMVPIPVHARLINAGHLQRFWETIRQHPEFEKRPMLQEEIKRLLETGDSEALRGTELAGLRHDRIIATNHLDVAYENLLEETYYKHPALPVSYWEFKKTLKLMKTLGRDAGELATRVVPEYKNLVAFVQKHPEKLVKAGEPIPSGKDCEKILKGRMGSIYSALALMGAGPLKYALAPKKLFQVLDLVDKLSGHPDIVRLVYEANQFNRSVEGSIQLLELTTAMMDVKLHDKIREMLTRVCTEQRFDIRRMSREMLGHFFTQLEIFDDTMNPAQLDSWNLNYISKLGFVFQQGRMNSAQQEATKDLCKAALRGQYAQYLHDPETPVGQANLKTRQMFETMFEDKGIALNYDTWLSYPGRHIFRKFSKAERLETLKDRFNGLLQAADGRDSEVLQRIQDVCHPLELEFRSGTLLKKSGDALSKDDLPTAVLPFLEALRQSSNTDIASRARDVEVALEDYLAAPNTTPRLAISLWKREPGQDLFLGNQTGACTALGSDNQWASIQALQNTFIQVATLKNADTGRTEGKALFFWAKDVATGAPCLILNTFEGRESEDGHYEENKETRDHLRTFAQNYARAVAGRDVPIYTGTKLNPLYIDDVKPLSRKIRVVGEATTGKFYLDTLSAHWSTIAKDHSVILGCLTPELLPDGTVFLDGNAKDCKNIVNDTPPPGLNLSLLSNLLKMEPKPHLGGPSSAKGLPDNLPMNNPFPPSFNPDNLNLLKKD